MKLMLLVVPLLLAGTVPPTHAEELPWRVENVVTEVIMDPPDVQCRPFYLDILNYTLSQEPAYQPWGGVVFEIDRFNPPSNSACEPRYTGPQSGTATVQFDFSSSVDTNLRWYARENALVELTGGTTHISTSNMGSLDPAFEMLLPAGSYHGMLRSIVPSTSALNGDAAITFIPVPEPSGAALVTTVMLFLLVFHRRILKGLRFQGGTEVSGVSGDK